MEGQTREGLESMACILKAQSAAEAGVDDEANETDVVQARCCCLCACGVERGDLRVSLRKLPASEINRR